MTSPQGPDGRTLTPDGAPTPQAVTPEPDLQVRPAAADAGPDWVRTPPVAAAPEEPQRPVPAPTEPSAPRLDRPSPPPGPRWDTAPAAAEPTTVLPEAGVRRPAAPAGAARPAVTRPARPAGERSARPAGKTRKARLALKRIDPWSVFVFSLVASIFLGIALVVAVAVLYSVLSALGVPASINELFSEVTGGDAGSPLLTSSRFVGGAAVLGAVNVVVLTLLATLGAVLYNLCASFTGGVELTLGERDG